MARTDEKRIVSLPPDLARYVDDLVEAGTFRSSDEVLRAGVRTLRARDAAMESWVLAQVVPLLGALRGERAIAAQESLARRVGWPGRPAGRDQPVLASRGRRNS